MLFLFKTSILHKDKQINSNINQIAKQHYYGMLQIELTYLM